MTPGNKYTIPWQWGTTGLGYNTKRVPGGRVDSWAALYAPNPSLVGHISLLREVIEAIGCTLIYLGKDPNSTKDADLQQVVDTFKRLRRQLRTLKFSSDTYIDELAAGETWLAQGWSGDVFQAQADKRRRALRDPQRGLTALGRCDVRAQGRPPPRERRAVHELRATPQVAARISKYVSYGTPVPLAKALLPPEQLNDPGIYPPASVSCHS
jgi:spermidine/putrescine transport system substrate-binding protein